uniref:Uncharacterized protein n=1 Tax=Arundo donax TaxID=35708 RepID=A0A0A8Y6E9_ARUDO
MVHPFAEIDRQQVKVALPFILLICNGLMVDCSL